MENNSFREIIKYNLEIFRNHRIISSTIEKFSRNFAGILVGIMIFAMLSNQNKIYNCIINIVMERKSPTVF